MHKIIVNPSNLLVAVELSGFFPVPLARQVADEVRRCISALGEAAGRHVTLYDLREAHIAPGETFEVFNEGFTNIAYRDLWARKVAFVTESALARLQLGRLVQGRPHMSVFTGRDEAIGWLLA